MVIDTDDPDWRDKVPKFKTAEERWKWIKENLDWPPDHGNDPNDPDSWLCPGEVPPKDTEYFDLNPNHMIKEKLEPYEPYTVFCQRGEWNAVPPKGRTPYKRLPKVIRFTHTRTVTPTDVDQPIKILQDLQRAHMDTEGCPDIKYNFAVGHLGVVYECRGWESQPEPLPDPESNIEERIDVAYIGDFTNEPPSWETISGATDFLEYAIHNNFVDKKCKIQHLDKSCLTLKQ